MLIAGDIGGTKTVVALYSTKSGPRQPLSSKTYSSKAYDSLEAIVDAFLEEEAEEVTHAAFGVAGPVVEGRAEITNLPWMISEQGLAESMGLRGVHLLNDLEAVATAVPILEDEDVYTLNEGETDPHGAIAVIAPGTGLGEAFLIWDGRQHRAFPCEGGHADFGPVGKLQQDLLAFLEPKLGHVSYERVCSGLGIPNLYTFLRDTGRHEEPEWLAQELAQAGDDTPVIVRSAQDGSAAICVATLELFIDILAREAGNLALKVLATGGVYLGGGIPPRILPQLKKSNFRETFSSKGRFRDLLQPIPVHVISRPDAGLMGAAYDALQMMEQEAGNHNA